MRKLAICAVLGASWVASPCLAQDYSFRCIPEPIDSAVRDPIVEIDVEHHGQDWSVIHLARSGAAYDRSTQYHMNNVNGAPSARWRGSKLTSPNLLMVGIVDNPAGQPKYTELLMDRSLGGAIIMQSEANCSAKRPAAGPPNSEATNQAGSPAPSPSPPSNALSGCTAVLDPMQRLACYDKVAGGPTTSTPSNSDQTIQPNTQPKSSVSPAPTSSVPSNSDQPKQPDTQPKSSVSAAPTTSVPSNNDQPKQSDIQPKSSSDPGTYVLYMCFTIDGQPNLDQCPELQAGRYTSIQDCQNMIPGLVKRNADAGHLMDDGSVHTRFVCDISGQTDALVRKLQQEAH